jgi:hypothetical protein
LTAPAPLPWIPGAIRQLLLADTVFSTACGGRLSTILPSSITFCGQVRTPGNNSISGDGVAFSPLVQVDGWCAPGLDGIDPERKAWEIGAAATRVLGRARNVIYQTMSYSARLIDGPIPDVDTSRGESSPLYRTIVRAELAVHVSPVP